MTVTPAGIAVELGRATPPFESPTFDQWLSWIERAYRAVQRRATECGVPYESLDPFAVDDVVTYAVARRAGRPVDGAESTTDQVQIDDGSLNRTRRYPVGLGDVHFIDTWWDMLGLSCRRGAFTISPFGAPDGRSLR